MYEETNLNWNWHVKQTDHWFTASHLIHHNTPDVLRVLFLHVRCVPHTHTHTFQFRHSFVFRLSQTHTCKQTCRLIHVMLLSRCGAFDIRLPAADAAAANANTAQSKKKATIMTERQMKPHAAEELLPPPHLSRIREKYSLQCQPWYSQSLPLGFHGWAVLLCFFVVMICIQSSCMLPPAPTKSQTQPPECDESDWFSVPSRREGLDKGGYRPCFGLSTFHLEAVK